MSYDPVRGERGQVRGILAVANVLHVTIGGGTHNVLYVAREHDSLYVNGERWIASRRIQCNGNGVFHEYDLGNVTFPSAGKYSFKFTVTGHNSSSSGYTVCFDYIKLTRQ